LRDHEDVRFPSVVAGDDLTRQGSGPGVQHVLAGRRRVHVDEQRGRFGFAQRHGTNRDAAFVAAVERLGGQLDLHFRSGDAGRGQLDAHLERVLDRDGGGRGYAGDAHVRRLAQVANADRIDRRAESAGVGGDLCGGRAAVGSAVGDEHQAGDRAAGELFERGGNRLGDVGLRAHRQDGRSGSSCAARLCASGACKSRWTSSPKAYTLSSLRTARRRSHWLSSASRRGAHALKRLADSLLSSAGAAPRSSRTDMLAEASSSTATWPGMERTT
jgi:hypothetical protein